MKKSFLMEHAGPFVVFGDYLYPTHSSIKTDDFVARPTASGGESLLYLLDPIPLVDIEGNDVFSKKRDISDYFESSVLVASQKMPMDPLEYKDRVDTLAFIIGGVFPLLAEKEEQEVLTPEGIVEEVLGEKPKVIVAKEASILDKLKAKEIKPYDIEMPEPEVANVAFPEGMFPPSDSSMLVKAINYNSFYADNGYAHILRKRSREGSDRIHINGHDFFWGRRYKLKWIDEIYIEMIRQNQLQRIREQVGDLVQVQKQLSEKNIYANLVDKSDFEFRNLVVRWRGKRGYLTIKRGPFARQDYEFANKWHPRGAFEIGAAIYFHNGVLFFSESPLVKVDYKDVAFYKEPFGTFRVLCSRDRDQWKRFPRDANGAALYIRTALDIFYNGFPPENVKRHVGPFGDGRTYRDICPVEKAITADSLEKVKKQGFLPTNYHIPLK